MFYTTPRRLTWAPSRPTGPNQKIEFLNCGVPLSPVYSSIMYLNASLKNHLNVLIACSGDCFTVVLYKCKWTGLRHDDQDCTSQVKGLQSPYSRRNPIKHLLLDVTVLIQVQYKFWSIAPSSYSNSKPHLPYVQILSQVISHKPVHIVGKLMLFIQLEDLHLRVSSGIVDYSVMLPLVTTYLI